MYEKRLGDAGYINFKLARTNNRGDGMMDSSSSSSCSWTVEMNDPMVGSYLCQIEMWKYIFKSIFMDATLVIVIG